MPAQSVSRPILISLICLLLIPTLAFAKSGSPEPLARATVSGSLAVWNTTASPEAVSLTVVGPDGTVYKKEFASGTAPSFRLQDLGATISDGSYRYEMRFAPQISPDVKRQLAAARAADDDVAAARIQRDAGIREEMVQSGSLTVSNGAFVNSDIEEPGSPAKQPVAASHGGISASSITSPHTVTPLDVVTADDIIVQGSACIGLDCVNNESFGFDTIRLKENNTRIKFEDTSTGSCPSNDWQLTANDACPGGNKFSIEDITGAKVPFTITGGAATNSIFVDSTGRLGLRTSTPVLDIHLATSNTPAMRLEQNSSGGFTAQTWDVAGNEANFFVRDVTGGSRLPFRIRPGAPTSSIDINASGNVGIGTASPARSMEISSSVVPALGFRVTGQATDQKYWEFSVLGTQLRGGVQNDANTTEAFWLQVARGSGNGISSVTFPNGNVGVGTTSPTSKLQVVGLSVFANNAAAVAGGLSAGAFYRTGGDPDLVCVVH